MCQGEEGIPSTHKNSYSYITVRSVILALPRMLSSEGSAKGKAACCQPTGQTCDQGRVLVCVCVCVLNRFTAPTVNRTLNH